MTNVSKAPKITLTGLLFATAPVLPVLAEGEVHSKEVLSQHKTELAEFVESQAKAIAGYLINKLDDTSVVTSILKAVPKAVTTVTEEIAKAAAEEAEKAEQLRIEEEAKRETERLAIAAQREEDVKKWMADFAAAGFDEATAAALVETGLAKKYGVPDVEKKAASRVTVVVSGKEYDIAERGNISQELKDLIVANGFDGDRAGFIEKFRKVPA